MTADQFVEFAFVAFMFGLPLLFIAGLAVVCMVVGIGAVVEWRDKRNGNKR